MNIDPTYRDAVNQWKMEASADAPKQAVEIVTRKVTESMRAVMQLKDTFKLSTEGMIFAVTQDKDSKGRGSTPDKLNGATTEQRAVLVKVYISLEETLGTVAKVATLFFGIWQVEEALNAQPEKTVDEMSIEERIEALEGTIAQLNNMLGTLPTEHPLRAQVEASLLNANSALETLIEALI